MKPSLDPVPLTEDSDSPSDLPEQSPAHAETQSTPTLQSTVLSPGPPIFHRDCDQSTDGPGLFEAGDLAAHFPRLELLQFLGRGGMGAVYLARQRHLNRQVVLKIMLPKFSAAPEFAERFVLEAKALGKLNHPHIVDVHDFGQTDDGMYFLLMEYVEGSNLRPVVLHGELSPPQSLNVAIQVCEALEYAHECGVIHRDIKPENVLLDTRGRVKVVDFGLAKLMEPTREGLTGFNQVMGTPYYMAPEQITRPTEIDHRADIYSLGVLMYEMLTGHLPLGTFESVPERASTEGQLNAVIRRCLEANAARRFDNVAAVREHLERICSTWKAEGPARHKFSGLLHQALWPSVLTALCLSQEYRSFAHGIAGLSLTTALVTCTLGAGFLAVRRR